MNERAHESSVGTYILIALILGVITYAEFALVQYDIPWLSSTWTLVVLATLSVAKFLLVILFFMHLKDDENTYSGFFSSGMLFALGTFIALSVLFLAPRSIAMIRSELRSGPAEVSATTGEQRHGTALPEVATGLTDAERALITSDGYSRTEAEIADTPPPKNRSIAMPLPQAKPAEGSYKVSGQLFGNAAAAGPPSTQQNAKGANGAQQNGAQANGGANAGGPSAQAPASWDKDMGDKVFSGNCMACHQQNGQGVPGAFPPLAGHLPDIYNADGGRDYILHAVVYGLQGQIDVKGQSFNGVMPSWSQLDDAQIANVINHELTSWGNDAQVQGFQPIQPDEVKAVRGANLTAQDVHDLRGKLSLP